MTDKYDEMAEKLLPCDCDCPGPGHWNCAAIYRPAVAAALREMGERDIVRQTAIANLHSVIREKDAKNERLKTQLEHMCGFLCDLCKCHEPVMSDECGDWFHPTVGKEGKDCEANVIRRGWAMGDKP